MIIVKCLFLTVPTIEAALQTVDNLSLGWALIGFAIGVVICALVFAGFILSERKTQPGKERIKLLPMSDEEAAEKTASSQKTTDVETAPESKREETLAPARAPEPAEMHLEDMTASLQATASTPAETVIEMYPVEKPGEPAHPSPEEPGITQIKPVPVAVNVQETTQPVIAETPQPEQKPPQKPVSVDQVILSPRKKCAPQGPNLSNNYTMNGL